MKLKECIEMGKCCGLLTLGESWSNIKIHSMQIFSYEKITEEMQELANEIDALNLSDDWYEWNIEDIVRRLNLEWYFKDEESKMYNCPSLKEKE